MAPQTTEHITTTPTGSPATSVTATPGIAKPGIGVPGPRPQSFSAGSNLKWFLLGIGCLLNLSILVYGGFLLFGTKKVAPSTDPIRVPFAENKELWDDWRSVIVLDEGRNKPLDTFARETVRFITSRETFEKRDPVAIIASWMMTYRSQGQTTDAQRIYAIEKKLNCDWEHHPFILCDYQELREQLFGEWPLDGPGPSKMIAVEKQHGKYIEPATLRSSTRLKDILNTAREKRRNDEKASLSMLESKAQELDYRLRMYDRVRRGEGFGVVALDRHSTVWYPLGVVHFFADPRNEIVIEGKKYGARDQWDNRQEEERKKQPEQFVGLPPQEYPVEAVKRVDQVYVAAQEAYATGDEKTFIEASAAMLKTIREVSASFRPNYPDADQAELEQTFNKVIPFRKAWIFCLLAVVLLAVSVVISDRLVMPGKLFYYSGLGTFIAALGWAAYGFYCRVSISGRPPVSDMYETIIWVSAMTGVFGLALELVYRRGFIILVASLVSWLGFLLADQLPNTFSPNIKQLSAVLRSQFWLIVHVITIVSSYAAFALAWGLGNLNLAFIVWRPDRKEQIRTLSHYSYKAIQIGAIMLFFGTMLGGWWAAESWGRFWGWDPKEVWALIAFLTYIIPLHARYVGWVKDFGLAVCSVVCFASVVMAWYGVNFVLGAGLHSYGFGSGSNAWLVFALQINVSLVVHAAWRYVSRGDHLVAAA